MRHTYLGAGLALCSADCRCRYDLARIRTGQSAPGLVHERDNARGRPDRGCHKVWLVQAGGHRSRTGEFSRIFGLRPKRCDRRGAGRGRHPEPVAILQQTGVKTQVFYTAYRRNIFGVAVPVDSPIKKYAV